MRKLYLVLIPVLLLGLLPRAWGAGPGDNSSIRQIKQRQKSERKALKLQQKATKRAMRDHPQSRADRKRERHAMRADRKLLRAGQREELLGAREQQKVAKKSADNLRF
jgi:hypothetical protein